MKTEIINALTAITLFIMPGVNFGQGPNLRTASDFALFTSVGAFSNDGATYITGGIGTNVGAFTGFPPGTIAGQIHVEDIISAQASIDVEDAYLYLSTLIGSGLGVLLGNGQILAPGIYSTGAASTLNGSLILDGGGDPSSLFIIKIDGAFATGINSNVILINSASLCNVYWQVNGQFDLEENSVFRGTIVANGPINLYEGSTLLGRGLSRAGAISLHNNIIAMGLQPTASIIMANGSLTFCAGDSVVLSGNSSGIWSNALTTPSITVKTSGDYFVTNSGTCGSVTSNYIFITVNPLPVAPGITATQPDCSTATGSITLSDLPSGSWTINPGAITGSTANITFSGLTAGTFNYSVTNSSGCVSTASANVVINARPPMPTVIVTNPAAVISPATVNLAVPSNTAGSTTGLAYTYWTNAAATLPYASPTTAGAGTYYIKGTTAEGCYDIKPVTVTVNPAPCNVCDSIVYVATINNDGMGSLRNAIAGVCNNGIICFNNGLDGQTITLTTGTLIIDKNITLSNNNHITGITINGSGNNITINPGKTLTLSSGTKLTVTGAINNNAGVSGFVIAPGASFIYYLCDLPATVQRYLTNGWHLFASPFKQSMGATLSNITPPGGSVQLKPYINGTGWGANITSPLYFLQPIVGYAVNPGVSFTASLTGILFCTPVVAYPSCPYTLSLVYNGTGANQSWNLLANSFTSSLNWNLLGKMNVSTTLYLWDNTLSIGVPVTNTAYLRTYNSANGIGVPAGTKPYIAPMQGFFVKAIYTNPKITFPLSARTHSTSNFYKDASNTEILVRLKTETEDGYDELVICKNPEAKPDFEEFDSEKMFDGQPIEMYSQSSSGENLVINSINTTKTIIPIGYIGNAGAKAKITAFALESDENVYLEDRFKGKIISLSENSSYDFEFSSDVISGRFFIRFGNINMPLTTSDVKIFENNNQLNIIAQTGEELQEVEVYSLTGACEYKAMAGSSNVFNTRLELSPAIYLVRVKTSVSSQNVKISWH